MKNATIILLLLLPSLCIKAQLAAGPMLGYTDFKEAKVWLQMQKPGKASIKYWPSEQGKKAAMSTLTIAASDENAHTAVFTLTHLSPGTNYEYELYFDGKAYAKEIFTLKTPALWRYRNDAPDFKIALGSCHYANQPEYDRPGKPYGDTTLGIFSEIVKQKADVMLWLGDNIYLREPDWGTRTGILDRYTHLRQDTNLRQLLKNQPNIAIWDDHDFGPNDANGSFINKRLTLEAFQLFWANGSYGLEDSKGITGAFQWNDAVFALLDNRYHRSLADSTVLGRTQVQWLKDFLLSQNPSDFKFVAMGGQFLNPFKKYETYSNLAPKERQEIIDFIYQHNIKNVVFLTGDRHHSVINKLAREGEPIIYEFTVSSLSARNYTPTKEEYEGVLVEGSIVDKENNFGTLEFKGDRKNRSLDLVLFGKKGNELFRYNIKKE